MFKTGVTYDLSADRSEDRTLSAKLECYGFVIEKKTDNIDGGKICLTPRELVALVDNLKKEFPNAKWE